MIIKLCLCVESCSPSSHRIFYQNWFRNLVYKPKLWVQVNKIALFANYIEISIQVDKCKIKTFFPELSVVMEIYILHFCIVQFLVLCIELTQHLPGCQQIVREVQSGPKCTVNDNRCYTAIWSGVWTSRIGWSLEQ